MALATVTFHIEDEHERNVPDVTIYAEPVFPDLDEIKQGEIGFTDHGVMVSRPEPVKTDVNGDASLMLTPHTETYNILYDIIVCYPVKYPSITRVQVDPGSQTFTSLIGDAPDVSHTASGFYIFRSAVFDETTHTLITEIATQSIFGVGKIAYGVLPTILPRSDEGVELLVNNSDGLGSARYLVDREFNQLNTKQLTPKSVVMITPLFSHEHVYTNAFLVDVLRRPQDYLVYSGWSDAGLSTYTAENFTQSAMSGEVGLPEEPGPQTDGYKYIFAVPADTGDINYFAIEPLGANQFSTLVDGATTVMLSPDGVAAAVEYKVKVGVVSTTSIFSTLPIAIGQEYP